MSGFNTQWIKDLKLQNNLLTGVGYIWAIVMKYHLY